MMIEDGHDPPGPAVAGARSQALFHDFVRALGTARTPRVCLQHFIEFLAASRTRLASEGRPSGGAPERALGDMMRWSTAQFEAMGTGDLADAYALHLLAAIEGATALAAELGDPCVIRREADSLLHWLRGL
ncbi:MAG: hypothetical protein V4864_07770 [Pseudomonadota bacterium]